MLKSQDKVYLLDGSCRTGKISEISGETITLEADETELIPREKVLLLEFKGGSIEMINKPVKDVIYNSNAGSRPRKPVDLKNPVLYNNISINTLALCNSDISCFYERILPKKNIGLGVMGAYNFNHSASLQNLFIVILNNAKKNYDIGLFGNYYLRDPFEKGTTFYCGVLFKYMNFKFSKAIEEKVNSGGVVSTNIKYSAATGSQLATIFTFGSSTTIAKNFYLKTIIGFGGFNMRGDYKQQYNYFIGKVQNSSGSSSSSNRSFMFKLYFGLNLAYSF